MVDNIETRVKKAVDEASKLAQALPEGLQVAAFNRAFDALLGSTPTAPTTEPGAKPSARTRRSASRPPERAAPESTVVPRLLQELSRGDYPEIKSGLKALDLALLVLKAARDKSNIEWLTAGEISRVLKDKFRLPVDTPAVRMALSSSTYVDRRPVPPSGFTYTLMEPGESYLAKLPAMDGTGDATAPKASKKQAQG